MGHEWNEMFSSAEEAFGGLDEHRHLETGGFFSVSREQAVRAVCLVLGYPPAMAGRVLGAGPDEPDPDVRAIADGARRLMDGPQ